ncbi:hypothetical protein DMENIID0001_018300 [Sergentomyia squamirostris]
MIWESYVRPVMEHLLVPSSWYSNVCGVEGRKRGPRWSLLPISLGIHPWFSVRPFIMSKCERVGLVCICDGLPWKDDYPPHFTAPESRIYRSSDGMDESSTSGGGGGTLATLRQSEHRICSIYVCICFMCSFCQRPTKSDGNGERWTDDEGEDKSGIAKGGGGNERSENIAKSLSEHGHTQNTL